MQDKNPMEAVKQFLLFATRDETVEFVEKFVAENYKKTFEAIPQPVEPVDPNITDKEYYERLEKEEKLAKKDYALGWNECIKQFIDNLTSEKKEEDFKSKIVV